MVPPTGFTSIGGVAGLGVLVTNTLKSYILRFNSPTTGKRTTIVIGDAEKMSLSAARAAAAALRQRIDAGEDVSTKRKEKGNAKALTFQQVAELWYKSRVDSGFYSTRQKQASVDRGYLERVIYPVFGDKLMDTISAKDVFAAVKTYWATTTTAHIKIRKTISAVWNWAVAMEMTTNPNQALMSGPLGVLLRNYALEPKQGSNHGSLDPKEVPDFVGAMYNQPGLAAKALVFSILTASRSQPVRQMCWKDVNLEEKVWVVPEASMKVKGRGNFVVYLSSCAVQLLQSLPRFGDTDLVFPSPRSHSVMSDASMERVIKRANANKEVWIDKRLTVKTGKTVPITQHGTARASFKTWTRTGRNLKRFHPDAVEMCLAHKLDDKFNGAYDRASLEKERRLVMEEWGKYCFKKVQPAP